MPFVLFQSLSGLVKGVSFAVAALLLEPAVAPVGPPREFEELAGFKTALQAQITSAIGGEKLHRSMGLPVEPGVYVTLSKKQMMIFDQKSVELKNGKFANPTIAVECVSKCPAVAFDAFRSTWLSLMVESKTATVEFPSRVLFAADGSISARTLIEAAYAAAETRPDSPPNMDIVVNGGNAGLRSRPFYLVPPSGLTVGANASALGLTMDVHPGGSATVSSAGPQFRREIQAGNPSMLKSVGRDLNKHFPSKTAIIIRATQGVTVADLVRAMTAVEDTFPTAVLRLDQEFTVQ